jgi:hypothetical protein
MQKCSPAEKDSEDVPHKGPHGIFPNLAPGVKAHATESCHSIVPSAPKRGTGILPVIVHGQDGHGKRTILDAHINRSHRPHQPTPSTLLL